MTSVRPFCSRDAHYLARTSCLRQPALVVRAPLFDSRVAKGSHRHPARRFPTDRAITARSAGQGELHV